MIYTDGVHLISTTSPDELDDREWNEYPAVVVE